MRCKNCGWPNQPGETNCVKCHAPLEADASAPEGTMPMTAMDASAPMRKTVLEPNPGMGTQQNAGGKKTCPQCGFPLREGAVKCPKCGAPLQAQPSMPRRATVINAVPDEPAKEAPKEPAQEAAAHNHNSFKNIKNPGMKTINPYIDGFDPIPTCSLKPFRRSNENRKIEDLQYEGEEINLTRDNTDPENPTISTECQAVISNENGRWFIEDKSDAHTTFVRAGEKMEIKDGSIVLLGNRLFEFHA